jgi:hypothetical protein
MSSNAAQPGTCTCGPASGVGAPPPPCAASGKPKPKPGPKKRALNALRAQIRETLAPAL